MTLPLMDSTHFKMAVSDASPDTSLNFNFHFHHSDNKTNEWKLPLRDGDVVLSCFEFSSTAEAGGAGQWSPADSRDVERGT